MSNVFKPARVKITITASGGSGTGYTYSIFNGVAHPTPPIFADYQASNVFDICRQESIKSW
jgi:hypothetical protein